MKLGLVKSCWIRLKTLNTLAQNNSLLFPKPVLAQKLRHFLSNEVKTLGHFFIKILFGHFRSFLPFRNRIKILSIEVKSSSYVNGLDLIDSSIYDFCN